MAGPVKRPDMIISPHAVRPSGPQPGKAVPRGEDAAFQKHLERALHTQALRFSAHAAKRLESRNIHLTPEQERKLQEAVDTAASKGARDSLILMNRLAFIVNIKNRTVITAMDQSQLQEKGIFTNIDSALIVTDV